LETIDKDMEYNFGQMGLNIKDFGSKIKHPVKANSHM